MTREPNRRRPANPGARTAGARPALLAVAVCLSLLALTTVGSAAHAAAERDAGAKGAEGRAAPTQTPLPRLVVKAIEALAGSEVATLWNARVLDYPIGVLEGVKDFQRDPVLSASRSHVKEETVAFVDASRRIWLIWTNAHLQQLERDYRAGALETPYIVAAYIGHELGHLLYPCDEFAAHALQQALLEEFASRGRLIGQEELVREARRKAAVSHPGWVPCVGGASPE